MNGPISDDRNIKMDSEVYCKVKEVEGRRRLDGLNRQRPGSSILNELQSVSGWFAERGEE